MRNFILLIIFFASYSSFAQDSTIVKAATPRIVTKLAFGESLKFHDIEIKFVKVLEDSRCPKDVTCIWAGEVIVFVDVLENGKFKEQKKVTVSPKSNLQNKIGNLFSSKTVTISGLDLLPYPISSKKTKLEDYYIQLDVRELRF